MLKLSLPSGLINKSMAVAIASVTAILIMGGLIVFLAADIQGRAKKIASTENELASRTNARESLSKMKQEYENIKNYVPAINAILPSRDKLLQFPGEIQTIARENRVTALLTFKEASEPPANQNLSATDFFLVIQGTPDSIISFLESVANTHYFIKFISLDYSRKDSGNFKAALNGKIFTK